MNLCQTHDGAAFVIISCKDRSTPHLFASLGMYMTIWHAAANCSRGYPKRCFVVVAAHRPDAESRHNISAS